MTYANLRACVDDDCSLVLSQAPAVAPLLTAAIRRPLQTAARPVAVAASTITGKVVDPNGNPIAGAVFKFDGVLQTTISAPIPDPATGKLQKGARVPMKTGPDGAFTFSGTPEKKKKMEISALGYQTAVFPDVTWEAGTKVDVGNLVLQPATAEEAQQQQQMPEFVQQQPMTMAQQRQLARQGGAAAGAGAEVKAAEAGSSWLKYVLIGGGVLLVGVGGFVTWYIVKKRRASKTETPPAPAPETPAVSGYSRAGRRMSNEWCSYARKPRRYFTLE